jgi:hypothetical protein
MAPHFAAGLAGRLQRWLLLAALCLMPPLALAGQSCAPQQNAAATFIKAMALAEQSWHALDASGAQVALIARAGQDISKYGLVYSHMALVWRDHPEGRWTVVHELNTCGTAESALYNEGLGNFFLDDMVSYQTEIVIPDAALQASLVRLLASPTAQRLHENHYNMVSYAFSTEYQNSNQWVLEMLAAASAAPGTVETRGEAQAWLTAVHFEPITVDIPAATRLGARLFAANVAFDDHPFGRRMAGKIDTVTVDSVFRFVERRDPVARIIDLRVP